VNAQHPCQLRDRFRRYAVVCISWRRLTARLKANCAACNQRVITDASNTRFCHGRITWPLHVDFDDMGSLRCAATIAAVQWLRCITRCLQGSRSPAPPGRRAVRSVAAPAARRRPPARRLQPT
jgi:hypothetical protein